MTQIQTGTDALRQVVLARSKSQNIGWLARELGVSNEALYAFGIGQTKLAPDVLQALTKEIYHGNALYDPAIDILRPINNNPPQPLGIRPPVLDPKTLPTYQSARSPARAPQPVKPTTTAKPVRPPGWAD